MTETKKTKAVWKQKIIGYWIIVLYLACFFCFFTWYRRLILAAYQISYLNYGMCLFEALVLSKVIVIGDVLRLGRGFENKPLIIPTLYKTVVFTLMVALFSVLERTVGALLRHRGLAGGVEDLINIKYEWLAKCLVVFFAFIPFFGFRELVRVLGKDKILAPFFRGRTETGKSG